MKVSNLDPTNVPEIDEFRRIVSIVLRDLVSVANGGIIFTDNFSAKFVNVTFTAANTETTVQHNLGRVPQGYIVYKLSAAAIIYDGAGSSTTTDVFLKASAPCTASIMLF